MANESKAPAGAPRFMPFEYELNWPRIHEVPAVVIDDAGERVTTTVGAVLRESLPGWFGQPGPAAPIPRVEQITGLTIAAPARTIRIDPFGQGHSGNMLLEQVFNLLRLGKDAGVTPRLFFYDARDWFHGDAWGTRYRFFVELGDDLVEDEFVLSDFCEYECDKAVLRPAPWCAEGRWGEPQHLAALRWHYRRFYSQMRAGQIMALRDDRDLFHLAPTGRLESSRDRRLARIEAALLLLVTFVILRTVFRWP